jgi:hypothetical protein
VSKFKSSRTSLKVDGEQVTLLADGHLGATILLMETQRTDPMEFMIGTALHLDDMNMRGEQIYQAFKWACTQAPEAEAAGPYFIAAIKRRDPEMVAWVNRMCPDVKPGEIAVESGAAYARFHNRKRGRA